MDVLNEAPMIPTDEFPELLAALRGLGANHEERRLALGVGSTKYVERILRRLPEPMAPFIRSAAAPVLLRALLADIERKAA